MMNVFKIRAFAVLLALLLCSWCGRSEEEVKPPSKFLHSDGRWIRDKEGRAVILRGVQVIQARPPYISWHAREDFLKLRGWGFNVIRLGTTWAAVEPEQGRYDDDYLDRLAGQVEWCREMGVSVVIDMHQDLYSEKYGGDGAPEWACLDGGVEFVPQQPWPANYFTKAVKNAFDSFWENRDGIQDRFAAMWAHVAARFAGDETVAGYDLFNEPFYGSHGKVTGSKEFDEKYLYPFIVKATDAIRSADPDHLVFFEPNVTKDMGMPCYVPAIDRPNLVYAPHVYDPKVVATLSYDGNTAFLEESFAEIEAEAAAWDLPWWLGEFGTMTDVIPENGWDYIRDEAEILDRYMAGWLYWSFDPSEGQTILWPDGSEKEVLNILARPYLQRTAGTPRSFSFDAGTKVFEAEWEPEPDGPAEAPTEVFIPAQRHYPDGYEVDCAGCRQEKDEAASVLRVWAGEGPRQQIRISPK